MPKTKEQRVISLFSGAGGLDIGFENAGFSIAVAVEIDPSCCDTLKTNRPDVPVINKNMFNDEGAIVGIIEIKAGLDPAGALERLGAMFKSFENTLAEYPDAVTILVASCITDEVEARLGASMSVRLKYITTEITSSENNQRKFANRMRKILKLIK